MIELTAILICHTYQDINFHIPLLRLIRQFGTSNV